MWGGTPDRNMVSAMKGLPAELGRQDQEEREVGGRPRLPELRQPGRRRRDGVRRHQQRARARQEPGRRPRRADGLPRVQRRVPVAADAPRSWRRAAPTTGRSRAWRARRWSRARSSTTSATGRVLICLDIQGFRDNENDGPFKDEKLTGQFDADVIWTFDMMEEVGAYPHNLANSSPVIVRQPDLRQHLERTGREPRQHPLAARAVDHRHRQEHREARVGGQLGRRPHPARPVVGAHPSARSAASCRSSPRRATAGSAATRRRRARSSGSSTPTRRTRSGRARATS